MTASRQYRKPPVVIDAMQWNGGAEAATPIIEWALESDVAIRYHEAVDDSGTIGGHWYRNQRDEHLRVETLEGTMSAHVGDWIIRGVKGEFYPCAADVFAATFEAVNG